MASFGLGWSGAIVFPLERFRIYPSIGVGVVAGTLAGLAAGFTLSYYGIDLPYYPDFSAVAEALTYAAIGSIPGIAAGVLVGKIRCIPLPGAG